MNEEALKKVLYVLTDLKASMHDAANTSVIEQLDEAIEMIEEIIGNQVYDANARHRVLLAIGKVFEKLPSIAALLQLLSK